jgi:hypothetical protein
MVDIDYLGLEGSQIKNLTNLPVNSRRALLAAPAYPFDGMNERGVVVAMAAVPSEDIRTDPRKKSMDKLAIMREILDHAGTVDEAVTILGSYNLAMGPIPLHYLIASAAGEAALVEFYGGKMVVFKNEAPWQVATNFVVAATEGHPQGQCPRYDRMSQRLQAAGGRLTQPMAMSLLAEVSQTYPDSQSAQSDTQWSIVYDMATGDVDIVMGRKYAESVHTLHLGVADHK